MNKTQYWKIYAVLMSLCIFGVVAVLPYIFTVQKDLITKIQVPMPVFFIVQLIQSMVVFSVAILIGLKLASHIGFSLPIVESVVSHKKLPLSWLEVTKLSVVLGIGAALAIQVLDYGFRLFGLNISVQVGYIPAWQRFLVAFYGGVNEEVIMRLFLMTALVFIGTKLTKYKSAPDAIVWTVIIITSVVFGLGHLPITSSITQITSLIIVRAIVLNVVGGVIFGWLYWKKGLEAAIIAHFTADLVLHFIIPLLVGM